MKRIALVAFALLLGVACEEGAPCDEYVSYMCDCHPEVDCDDLRAALSGGSAAQQDQCAIDLEDQQQADGGTCPSDDT